MFVLFSGTGYNTLDSRKTLKQRRYGRKGSATPSGSSKLLNDQVLTIPLSLISRKHN